MSEIVVTQCASCKRKYPALYQRCPYCKHKPASAKKPKESPNPMRGKMASNERIDQNVDWLVDFNQRYEKMRRASDRAGLLALAQEAQDQRPKLALKAWATAMDLRP
jgi:hypothetical protein